MQDFKNYIVPGVALVMVLAWFFIIAPMLDDEASEGETQASPSDVPGPVGAPPSSPAPERSR